MFRKHCPAKFIRLNWLTNPQSQARSLVVYVVDQRTGSGVWWDLWVICCTNSDPLEI